MSRLGHRTLALSRAALRSSTWSASGWRGRVSVGASRACRGRVTGLRRCWRGRHPPYAGRAAAGEAWRARVGRRVESWRGPAGVAWPGGCSEHRTKEREGRWRQGREGEVQGRRRLRELGQGRLGLGAAGWFHGPNGPNG